MEDGFVNVKVIKDGPLLVCGNFEIVSIDGSKSTKQGCTSFCRCGASKNKPNCDGSHAKIDFKD
ncbi:CDGSH iron-sulfur domain-containing protein [Bacteroidales bacterium OttesenSCG-928-K03]|nr:CDGSH iron-sulfur domain-containing protein [Bacteroidales bacterium OttesenSCG-928-K03]